MHFFSLGARPESEIWRSFVRMASISMRTLSDYWNQNGRNGWRGRGQGWAVSSRLRNRARAIPSASALAASSWRGPMAGHKAVTMAISSASRTSDGCVARCGSFHSWDCGCCPLLFLLAEDVPPLQTWRDRILDWIACHRPHWLRDTRREAGDTMPARLRRVCTRVSNFLARCCGLVTCRLLGMRRGKEPPADG
jgi:hypothetical protein